MINLIEIFTINRVQFSQNDIQFFEVHCCDQRKGKLTLLNHIARFSSLESSLRYAKKYNAHTYVDGLQALHFGCDIIIK